MQTAVIDTESTLNLNISNHPHESMNHPNPLAFIPGYQSHPLPSPRAHKVLCYEEPGGVMCLEEVDIAPEFDAVAAFVNDADIAAPLAASATLADLVNAPQAVGTPPDASEEPATDVTETTMVMPPTALEAPAVPKSDKDLPFHGAGMNFSYPKKEAAVLAMILHGVKGALTDVVEAVTTEHFFVPENNTIFRAVAHLHAEGQLVTVASVLAHLKATLEDFGTEWIDYVNSCASSAFNPKHLKGYLSQLAKAVAIRGGDTFTLYKYSEAFCYSLLKPRLPLVKCVDEDWYVYYAGAWKRTDRAIFAPAAMESMHPDHRQSSRVGDLLDHVQLKAQVPRQLFSGAYKWDSDRILINANNCVLEVDCGGMVTTREHSPDDHFTLKLPTDYVPGATCSTFMATLMYALPDAADRIMLQAFAGYTLYPGCEYEALFVGYGPGGTGKSTLLNGIGQVFGEDLCGVLSLEQLCKPSGYELSKVKDKMLNLGTEINGREIDESANLKKLVSGEAMLTREIYRSPEQIKTTCKLAFLTNIMPTFRGGSDAEVRRMRILHFDRKPEVQDPSLGAKIKAEKEGVFNWMLEGLRIMFKRGGIPEGGKAAGAAKESFRVSNDPVGAFVGERCRLNPADVILKRDLMDAFKEWCDETGHHAEKTENYFFKTLRQRYPAITDSRPTIANRREHCLNGIGLVD